MGGRHRALLPEQAHRARLHILQPDQPRPVRHVNTSISTGYSTALLNSGVLTNKGIEIKLNTIPVKTKNWQWDLGFNFARNSNKVHSLGESQMSKWRTPNG